MIDDEVGGDAEGRDDQEHDGPELRDDPLAAIEPNHGAVVEEARFGGCLTRLLREWPQQTVERFPLLGVSSRIPSRLDVYSPLHFAVPTTWDAPPGCPARSTTLPRASSTTFQCCSLAGSRGTGFDDTVSATIRFVVRSNRN